MILNFYRWFCGYLTVLLSGRKAGRFLNLCTKRGILIWEVLPQAEDQYQFCMYKKDFRKVRPLCKKTGTRLRIKKRWGLPFFLHRYRGRVLFPAAFAAAAGWILFCSNFIWKIEIIGNSNLSEETLIRYLEEKNAGFGTSKDKIDMEALELSLRQDFPQVIWASSYIEGTKLVVEIQENLKTEDASYVETGSDPSSCKDITAQKDAVIASILTRNGVPLVKAGDTVEAGQILVSGRQEILDDSGSVKEYFYQSADADITGYVTYPYEDRIPAAATENTETGRQHSVYFLELFGKRLETPKLFNDFLSFYCMEDYHQLRLGDNFYLPVFWGERNYIEQTQTEITYDETAAKKLAAEHFYQFLEDLEENGVSIIGKNVMIEKIGDFYQVSGTIEACEPIGERTPTEIRENPVQEEEEGNAGNEHE